MDKENEVQKVTNLSEIVHDKVKYGCSHYKRKAKFVVRICASTGHKPLSPVLNNYKETLKEVKKYSQ